MKCYHHGYEHLSSGRSLLLTVTLTVTLDASKDLSMSLGRRVRPRRFLVFSQVEPYQRLGREPIHKDRLCRRQGCWLTVFSPSEQEAYHFKS